MSTPSESSRPSLGPGPRNLEAERALLGGMMLDNRRIADVLQAIPQAALPALAAEGEGRRRRTEPDEEPLFSSPANQEIFDTMRRLFERDEGIDPTTVGEELDRAKRYEAVGGAPYLASLEEEIVTTFYLLDYARIVVEKWRYRSLLRLLESIASDVARAQERSEVVVDRAAQRLFDMTQRTEARAFAHVADVALDVVKEIEARAARDEDAADGVLSGFSELDRMTAGFRPSNLVILAARPSVGKSAFAMNIARFNAVERGRGVAVFSLEMSKEELVQRMLCTMAKVPMGLVRSTKIPHEERMKLQHWADELEHAPLYIDDSSDLSILELRAKTRKLAAQLRGNLALVVVDYLQLMRGPDRAESRQQEVSAISRGLKALARDVACPVIALSQLSRQSEQRGGKNVADRMPRLSDLRESGAIEQDADVVLFIHREFPRKKDDEEDERDRNEPSVVTIRVGKQRNGPVGDFNMLFRGQFTEFVDIHPDAYGGARRR